MKDNLAILTEEQENKLKSIQLLMLKEFIRVCEKLNLKYFIIAGTLIGAVRHKGFIPWDDDIDVAMKREDYEIFIRKAQKEFSERYFVQTFHSEPDVPFNFCKIRDNETTFVEYSMKNIKINHGVGLDVFPLDYVPETDKDLRKFYLKKRILSNNIAKIYTIPNINLKYKIKNFARKSLFLFFPYRKAVLKRDILYRSVKNSDYIANFCGIYGQKEICPKWWFDETIELEFEGIKVKAPKQYDLMLRQIYGDYMQLPPMEKRKAHHYAYLIDLERNFKDYI